MAEPTCIIQPLSYNPPAFSSETLQQENPGCTYGVEESVSFGRFTSDSLGWERWSSFNNNRNRYVEEAEKYSRPGSVAQKKAYFEAHFKRMAALKAAALLEQQAASASASADHHEETQTGVVNNESESCCYDAEASQVNLQIQDSVEGFVVHQNQLYSPLAQNHDQQLSAHDNDMQVVETPVDVDQKVLEDTVVLEVQNMKTIDKQELSGNALVQIDKPPLQEKTILKEEVSAAVGKKNPSLSSFLSPIKDKEGGPLFASSPARTTFPVHPGKENYATPLKNKSSISDPDKKRTPLRASINREFNRILSPVIRKIGSSSRTSKDYSTPSSTLLKGSLNGVPQPPPITPDTTKRGRRSHDDSSAGERKPAAPRWHILSDGFKSPNHNRNKISSPIIPTSFCLRGRERAAKRKQKLEDKFNATTEKPPQPPKFKEKAEAELNKFRQSFCFKVMSSPDHYTMPESQNKNECTHCESPKQSGRQPNTSISESRGSLPPRRPTLKASSLKNIHRRK